MSLEQATAPRIGEAPFDYRTTFSRAAQLLAAAGDFREALEHTLASCLPVLGDFGFFDAREGDRVVRVARAHEDERVEAILRPTQWMRQERDDMNLCALSTGLAALHPNIDDGWYRRVAFNDEHLAVLRDLGFRSMITVPMHFRGDLIGALTLFMGRSRRRHSAAHMELAADIAAMAAPVVANARLLEEHRRTEHALRVSEERLQLAQIAAGLGTWDWNVATNEVYWSPKYREIYGLSPTRSPISRPACPSSPSRTATSSPTRWRARCRRRRNTGRCRRSSIRTGASGGWKRWARRLTTSAACPCA
jgi:PAS domain-containing protein